MRRVFQYLVDAIYHDHRYPYIAGVIAYIKFIDDDI